MKRRNLTALFLALVMALSLSVNASAAWGKEEYPAAAKTVTELADVYSGKTVILHTNDVHGQIDGYAYLAQLKTDFTERGAEVVVVDAGDFSNGDPNVSISRGMNAVTMMNAAGYDVVTLGNHEFDFGYEQLRENLKDAAFRVICADVLDEEGEPFAEPNCVLTTKGGLKLGFFGMETPETLTKVKPAAVQGLTFFTNSNGKTDLYDCAKAQVAALKAEQVDLIISLAHLGVNYESAQDGHRSIDMYTAAPGIDFIIDGHSHTVMTAGENGEPIQSTGTKFANIGVIIIDNAEKKIEDNFLYPISDGAGSFREGVGYDEAVAAKSRALMDEVDEKYGAAIATSEVLLNGERAYNRTQETNLGDLITDAMRWAIMKDGADAITVPADRVVALVNSGSIRASIAAGGISMKDVNTVLPFGNTVAVVYATGAQLLEVLEASTFSTPNQIGGYPQTAGIRWTIDTTKEYKPNAETYPASTYYGPASIERVTIESINGKAFDPAETYAVVTNDFCAGIVGNPGDTYYAFSGVSAKFDTAIPMDEEVVAYITEELGGVVSAERYGTSDGEQTRILATAEEEAAPAAPAAPAVTESAAPSEPEAPADASEDTYTVRSGDSLWSIAKKILGNGNFWGTLYELNRVHIRNPALIYIGQVLRVR